MPALAGHSAPAGPVLTISGPASLAKMRLPSGAVHPAPYPVLPQPLLTGMEMHAMIRAEPAQPSLYTQQLMN
jgi:hypothetical protein